MSTVAPNHRELLAWLREENSEKLEILWRAADEMRRRHVGDEVHLRGLIEISSYCVRRCAYCGLRAGRRDLVRYRMTAEEVMDCVRQAEAFGYGTAVLQAGEDTDLTSEWVADLIRRIKDETALAVTLSLGERPLKEYAAWREAGADRYLLRFETSNPELYARIHPGRRPGEMSRIEILKALREMGYEIGGGAMVGIPGATYDDQARDLELFRELDLDMIGIGPFIAHPDTPLGNIVEPPAYDQAPNTELMTYKMVALARLMRPDANIPSTTALATLNLAQGRELGLARGANVVMPNLTPPEYRALYEIYPAKAGVDESAAGGHLRLVERIGMIGRRVGRGHGDSPGRARREAEL